MTVEKNIFYFLLIQGDKVINNSKFDKKRHKINEAIKSPYVRLIAHDGVQISEKIALEEALAIARKSNMDLVEFFESAEVPTCRIMNYGAFNFKKQKSVKSQKKAPKLKEIKLRPVTDEGDFQVKLRNLISFIEKGSKVKVTLRFRGREIAHQELAHKLFNRIVEATSSIGQVDSAPKLEGRQMIMMLSPKNTKNKK